MFTSKPCRISIPLVLCVLLSGCASDGTMKRWGQCALIGGGSGGLLGAIESASAAAGGAVVGAALGGLLCYFTGKDADGDDVSDDKDQCPYTPTGVKVDETGCPVDSDGDGVADYMDQCPRTSAGIMINEFGCPDSDNDGVADNIDLCPNTPAGAWIDSKGCSIDSDGDGVPDGIDQCSNTPSGTPVDAQGCPVSQNLGSVLFKFDKDILSDDAKAYLDTVAIKLNQDKDIKLKAFGYTDTSGDPTHNKNLCQKRADAIIKYLIEKGVNPENIKALVGGIIKEHNETRAERAANRKAGLVTTR